MAFQHPEHSASPTGATRKKRGEKESLLNYLCVHGIRGAMRPVHLLTVVLVSFLVGCAPLMNGQHSQPATSAVPASQSSGEDSAISGDGALHGSHTSSNDQFNFDADSGQPTVDVAMNSQTAESIAMEVERELRMFRENRQPPPGTLEGHPPPASEDNSIPIIVNEQVKQYIKFFQTEGRDAFQSWLARYIRYKDLIQDILRRNGLPDDLIYVAMIESGFRTSAYSRQHAAGLWQFMASTGRKYGLTVNPIIDERRDPEKSTQAAALYFKDLYKQFGDWHLAMAGYNAGEGTVCKAIERKKSNDYWELCESRYLKRETKNFVPKILAAAVIAKNPAEYGFTDIPDLPPLNYEIIAVDGPFTLKDLAEATGYAYAVLVDLNPALKKNRVPQSAKEYELKVPKGSGEIMLASAARAATKPRAHVRDNGRDEVTRHTIRRGETLSTIASKYGTSVRTLMELNNIARANAIKAGATIVVATNSSPERKTPQYTKTEYPSRSTQKRIVHLVRKGDNLWSLSRQYGVDLKDFYKWNDISQNKDLKPGDKLTIYVKEET